MRSVLALIVVLTLATGAAAAPGKGVPRLIFPVVGTVSYTDDFGAPRAGGAHQGIDILAARRAPAVAVEAGTVEFWTTSANAGCMLYLHGASGTTYLYIHLNNDLTNRNDNRGTCVAGTAYAPGLKDGARVAAGQLVAYVGDSGDANGIHPHLHFEVHPGGGAAVDGYPYLRKAQPLIFYAKKGTTVSLSLTGTIVASFAGDLELKTSSVQPNSEKPIGVRRAVVLSVAPDAQVLVDVPGVTVGLEALLAGMRATVYTLPVRATLAAQRGDANALTATRILLAH
jgi:murein DD-endopeptidase MepM/ murein hydrolase activator NlpD